MLIRRAHKITWPSGGTESATNFMLLSAVFWGFSCMHPKSILKRSPKSAKETALELCWKFSSQRHLPFSAGSKCAVNIMLSAAMCWAFLFQHDKNLQKRALKSIKRAPKSTKIRSRAAQKVWKLIKKKSKVIRNLLGRSEKQKRQRDPKETPRTPKVMKSSWSPTIFILVFLGKDQETHSKQGYRSNWSVNSGKLICTPVFPQILDTDQVSYWSVPRFCQKIGVQINFLFFSSAPRSAVKSWSVPLFFLKTRVQINLILFDLRSGFWG